MTLDNLINTIDYQFSLTSSDYLQKGQILQVSAYLILFHQELCFHSSFVIVAENLQ